MDEVLSEIILNYMFGEPDYESQEDWNDIFENMSENAD